MPQIQCLTCKYTNGMSVTKPCLCKFLQLGKKVYRDSFSHCLDLVPKLLSKRRCNEVGNLLINISVSDFLGIKINNKKQILRCNDISIAALALCPRMADCNIYRSILMPLNKI